MPLGRYVMDMGKVALRRGVIRSGLRVGFLGKVSSTGWLCWW